MFDTDEDEFDNEELTGSDLVKSLRKQLAAANKALKEQGSMIEEMQSARHQQSVTQMLSEYGLNPKIAAFIPDDVESEADLDAWLDEYGDAFGIVPADGDEGPDDPDAETAELMADLEEDSIDPQVGHDLESRMKNAGSAEEILALARSAR